MCILAQLVIAPGQIVKSSRVIVLVTHALPVSFRRLRVLLGLIIISVTQPKISEAIVGLHLHGVLVRSDRFLRSVQFEIGIAEFLIGFGIIGLERRRLSQRFYRLRVLSLVVVDPTNLIVRRRVISFDGNRAPVGVERLVVTFQTAV